MEKMVEQLAHQFEFFIFTSNKDLGQNTPLSSVVSDSWEKCGKANVYYSSNGLSKAVFKKEISRIDPDVVYVNGIFSFHFSIKPIWFSRSLHLSTKIILAPRGMLGEGAMRFKKAKKSLFLLLAKHVLYAPYIHWHATDQNEKESIFRLVGEKANVTELSNFFPDQLTSSPTRKKAKTLRLLFLSRISEKKNLLFLLDRLNELNHDVFLRIIGPLDEPDYWKKCETVLRESSTIHYEYLGAIPPNELQPYFSDIHYFALPTFHENFGHVIAESLAFLTPVIISTHTPFRNLKEKGLGYDIPLSQPQEWKTLLKKVLEETKEEYAQQVAHVKKTYKTNFNNQELVKKYKHLLSNE